MVHHEPGIHATVSTFPLFSTRRALADLEQIAAEFLNWFLVPSLQRNLLYELISDLAAAEAKCGEVPPYARTRRSHGNMALGDVQMSLRQAE